MQSRQPCRVCTTSNSKVMPQPSNINALCVSYTSLQGPCAPSSTKASITIIYVSGLFGNKISRNSLVSLQLWQRLFCFITTWLAATFTQELKIQLQICSMAHHGLSTTNTGNKSTMLLLSIPCRAAFTSMR